MYFHFIFVRSSSSRTRGKNGNLPSNSSFLELGTPSQPNIIIRQLQLHPELTPPGVLEWSSSTQSWSHAKQGLRTPPGMKEENCRISISKEFISCSSLWLIRICHRKTKGKKSLPSDFSDFICTRNNDKQ